MRILIVEDEPPAREKLVAAIRASAPDAEIAGALAGVAETVEWLQSHPPPDLLFLDIQLVDGLSFEILRRVPVACPVVFATAFDEYILEALETNGIDYLLKPIRDERVAAAIGKYRRLRGHFRSDQAALLEYLDRGRQGFRKRFLVRKGIEFVSLRTAEAAWFHTAEKLVFLVTRAGVRYLLDRPLAEIESELDPARFFRVNRAYLVEIEAVARCRSYGKGKLLLDLRPPAEGEVIVSQERAAAFRTWLGG